MSDTPLSSLLAVPGQMTLGQQLKELRLAKGLTQQRMAEILDVGQGQVSAIENGTRATTTAVLEAWARACDAIVSVHRPDQDDPLMRLIIAARDLDAWDLRMLRDIAVSLPRSGLTQKQKARYAHLFLDDGGDL